MNAYDKLSDEELTVLVAERVMGLTEVARYGEWTRYRDIAREQEYGGRWTSVVPDYASDIAAAMQVVEKIRLQDREVAMESSSTWEVIVWDGPEPKGKGVHESLPRAICIAAMSSIQATSSLASSGHNPDAGMIARS